MPNSWRLREWFPDIPAPIHERLESYRDVLLKFNETINLVSDSALLVLDQQHFADSILGGRIIHSHIGDKEIYDLGSGNGLPGIIYAILFPQSPVVLVDSDTRKGEFLKHLSFQMKLANVSVKIMTIEALDAMTLAMCRGLASIPKALLAYRKNFKTTGELWMFKGEEWVAEASALPTQLSRSWDIEFIDSYILPDTEIALSIVQTRKMAE